jgi:hypothetical protein
MTCRFGLENKAKHNDEVRSATKRIFEEIIPKLVPDLELKIPTNVYESVQEYRTCLENLVSEVHKRGINLRYLGHVASHVKIPQLQVLIMTEALCRYDIIHFHEI